MTKPTVGVFFGSRSAEHDVSIITALAAVIKPLKLSEKFTVVPVYISKQGKWYCEPKLADIGLYTSGKIDTFLQITTPVAVSFDHGLQLIKPGLRTQRHVIDIAFPATHGTHGEDGELMGIFELAGIPYVGCGVEASAIAMDKVAAKRLVAAHGIATPRMCVFSKGEFAVQPEAAVKSVADWQKSHKIASPLFVKPAHLGSSIGITRVNKIAELHNALEVALHYDDLALVEEGINNLVEVTLPVMGNETPRPALLEQPLVHSEDFFDFDTKYMQGGKKGQTGGNPSDSGGKLGAQGYSQIPADLPKALYDTAEQTGLAVYKALGCSGIARVDLLIDTKTQTVYFNELNPLPGSLYSHNWNRAGLSNVQLVTDLIDLALERHANKQKLETSFTTNYLKQF